MNEASPPANGGDVTAQIGYAVDTGEKPVNETFEAGQVIRRRTGTDRAAADADPQWTAARD